MLKIACIKFCNIFFLNKHRNCKMIFTTHGFSMVFNLYWVDFAYIFCQCLNLTYLKKGRCFGTKLENTRKHLKKRPKKLCIILTLKEIIWGKKERKKNK